MKKNSKNSFFATPMEDRPISKVIGSCCGACGNFSHKDFEQHGRLKTVRKQHAGAGVTFGRCAQLDADDAIATHRACEHFMEATDDDPRACFS